METSRARSSKPKPERKINDYGVELELVEIEGGYDSEGNHLPGETLWAHIPEVCSGPNCSIHNPSDHHMAKWRQHWRGDRGIIERLCPDLGIGHPDPDDMAHHKRMGRGDWVGVHGCDGCCYTPDLGDPE